MKHIALFITTPLISKVYREHRQDLSVKFLFLFFIFFLIFFNVLFFLPFYST